MGLPVETARFPEINEIATGTFNRERMDNRPRLFMLLIGCKPPGRHTEQHDIFFGIGHSIGELIPDLMAFWPETGGKLHIDAWREVNHVHGFRVQVAAKQPGKPEGLRLFFINLGGYKPAEFDEFHYKVVLAASSGSEAIQQAKKTVFYRHTHFPGAESHIDDKYGVDVDDLYEIEDILPLSMKSKYSLILEKAGEPDEDPIHLGYFKLNSFKPVS